MPPMPPTVVTHSEHLRGILGQIGESHAVLSGLGDKKGDLEIVKREIAKINGMVRVVITKIDPDTIQLSDYTSLRAKMRRYHESYSFEQEIETMATLYSDDLGRIRNMRLKILEALDDRGMIKDLGEVVKKL